MTEIKYSWFGIANRFDEEIILHQALLKPEWDSFRTWLINHETSHSSGSYSKHDFQHDFKDSWLTPQAMRKAYIKFFFLHPGAWLQSSPALWYKGKLWWDVSKIINFIVYTGIISILIWLIKRKYG